MIGEIHRCMAASRGVCSTWLNKSGPSSARTHGIFLARLAALTYCTYHVCKVFSYLWLGSFGCDDRIKLVRCRLLLADPQRTISSLAQCKRLLGSIRPCDGKSYVLFKLAHAYIHYDPEVTAAIANELPPCFQLILVDFWGKSLLRDPIPPSCRAIMERCIQYYQDRAQICDEEWKILLVYILYLRSSPDTVVRIINATSSTQEKVARFRQLKTRWPAFPPVQGIENPTSVGDKMFTHLSLADIYHDSGELALAMEELGKGKTAFTQVHPLIQARHLALYVKVQLAIAPGQSTCTALIEMIGKIVPQIDATELSFDKYLAYQNVEAAYRQLGHITNAEAVKNKSQDVLREVITKPLLTNDSLLFPKLRSYLLITRGLLDLNRLKEAETLMQEWLNFIPLLPQDTFQETEEKKQLLQWVYGACFEKLKPLAQQAVQGLEQIYDSTQEKDELGAKILGFYNDLCKGTRQEPIFFGKYRENFQEISIKSFHRCLRESNLKILTREQKKALLDDFEQRLPRISSQYEEAAILLADAYLTVDKIKSAQLIEAYQNHRVTRHLIYAYAVLIPLAINVFYSKH